jgi:hypothetical protein
MLDAPGPTESEIENILRSHVHDLNFTHVKFPSKNIPYRRLSENSSKEPLESVLSPN